MTQSKYQEAIDLHNKAIEILEKRRNAVMRHRDIEYRLETKQPYGGETEADMKQRGAVQERYIKILTRAYGRLAASVCAEVANPVMTRDVVNDLDRPKKEGWETIKTGSITSSGTEKENSLFDLIMPRDANREVKADGNDFHIEKLSTDEQKAD